MKSTSLLISFCVNYLSFRKHEGVVIEFSLARRYVFSTRLGRGLLNHTLKSGMFYFELSEVSDHRQEVILGSMLI